MNDYWLKLKNWYVNLTAKEQKMVGVGGIIAAILFVYAGIWSPIANQVDTLRNKMIGEQKTLVWMKNADKEITNYASQVQQAKQKIPPVTMLSILQKQITSTGIAPALNSLKQASNESIEMHFQKVEFDRLIAMLMSVMKQHAVTISQFSVVSVNSPGLVDADVVLTLE